MSHPDILNRNALVYVFLPNHAQPFFLSFRHFFNPAATHQNLVDKEPWLLGLRRDALELGGAALTAVPLPEGRVLGVG